MKESASCVKEETEQVETDLPLVDFGVVVGGKARFDVCRLFLASLQLVSPITELRGVGVIVRGCRGKVDLAGRFTSLRVNVIFQVAHCVRGNLAVSLLTYSMQIGCHLRNRLLYLSTHLPNSTD